MASDSMLSGGNALYLEELLEQFLQDPTSVDPSWRRFFAQEGRALAAGPRPKLAPSFEPGSLFAPSSAANGHGTRSVANGTRAPGASSPGALEPGPEAFVGADPVEASVQMKTLAKQGAIVQLIEAYRAFGHMRADLDPLGRVDKRDHPELRPDYWGLGDNDMDREFSTAALCGPVETMTLRQLVAFLERTYCGTIGCEFMHINDATIQTWMQAQLEGGEERAALDSDTKRFVMEGLCAADAFENFIHVKYRGAKRFSLEGGEVVVPLLDVLIEESGRHGVQEIVLGMPHRGRLNVLAHIFEKTRRAIFQEFEDFDPESMFGRGDVKYHLGYSSDRTTRHGDTLHLSLTFNPSHLEAINPVVEGRCRAKQDRFGDASGTRCMPVLLHGDAAFPGQGLVAETLNLMALDGYTTGGTVHVIVNNQIGFTTNPRDGRSTAYCTDIAKMVEVPIFHVNGEDPEAVVHAVRIASEFRAKFHRDVILDVVCYRRYGHNEADEPSFTQPLMYQAIKERPSVRTIYADKLVAEGTLTEADVAAIWERQQAELDRELKEAREASGPPTKNSFGGVWAPYQGGRDARVPEVPTAITPEVAARVLEGLVRWPADFTVHPRLMRVIKRRQAMAAGEAPLDWGAGESLAYGSLLAEGHHVRITGQDVERGTFSHRHAVLNDAANGSKHIPLRALAADGARFDVYNSPLSEAACLGFEFGYALDMPEALVIWEAQFGDFANGAQVIIDQFISASEDKWDRLSAVTLLLPHGYEGQGPEHSSARFERFLALCAEDNIQVANLTTPAQIFHALRRQVLRPWRKPLVVMSPKSLLRLRDAASPLEDFTTGGFQRVIGDADVDPAEVDRVVLCTGKVYYDLRARRAEVAEATGKASTTALVRLEQLYPYPEDRLREELARFPRLSSLAWCQEEPRNMGAYSFLYPRLVEGFGKDLQLSWHSRAASASPATGSSKAHHMEQARLLDGVFPRG